MIDMHWPKCRTSH